MFNLFKTESDVVDFGDIQLFNTESRDLEVFTPLSKHEVKIYTCGPTVYDFAHIGNLRAYVFADTLKRVLAYNGYHVNHTINFTDFGHLTSDADTGDDKMMKGLRREGMELSLESMRTLGEFAPEEMIVLVDGGSASASEILAGALQEHGIAKLMGEQTFGKGSVQELVGLDDGSSLKVTVARWFTPNGVSISEGGLTPDIFVERTPQQVIEGVDPQLQAAIEYLNGNKNVGTTTPPVEE